MAPGKSKKIAVVGQDAKGWTKGQTIELLKSIKDQLVDRDEFPYHRRMEVLNWKQIKPACRTVVERKSRLQFLIKKIHRIRTLAEILSDVDLADLEVIDMKKSKTSFALFCEEMKKNYVGVKGKHYFKVASQRYQKLTLQQKEYYKEESKRLSLDSKEQCSNETAERSSLTPLKLFVKHHEKNETSEDQLKRQYKTLDDIDRLFWIRKSITAHEEVDIKTILTDDEFSLFQDGPKQMTNTINFCKMKLQFEVDPDAASVMTGKTNSQDNLNGETPLKSNDDNQTTSSVQDNPRNSFEILKRKRTEQENVEIINLAKKNKKNEIEPVGEDDNESVSTNNTSTENVTDKPLELKRRRETVEFDNKLLEIRNVEIDGNLTEPMDNVLIISKENTIKVETVVNDQQEVMSTVIESPNVINPIRKDLNKRIKVELEKPRPSMDLGAQYSDAMISPLFPLLTPNAALRELELKWAWYKITDILTQPIKVERVVPQATDSEVISSNLNAETTKMSKLIEDLKFMYQAGNKSISEIQTYLTFLLDTSLGSFIPGNILINRRNVQDYEQEFLCACSIISNSMKKN